MIRQMLKLIWNRKRSNVFLILEFLLVFFVMDAIFAAGIDVWRRYRQPDGFSVRNVIQIVNCGSHNWLQLYGEKGDDEEKQASAEMEQLVNNLKDMDEVIGVGITDYALYGVAFPASYNIHGKNTRVAAIGMSDECAKVLGVELIQGRWFTAEDAREGEDVLVINRKLRDALLPGVDPIGKYITDMDGKRGCVVGVVSDFQYLGKFANRSWSHYIQIKQIKLDSFAMDFNEGAGAILVKLKSAPTAKLEARIHARFKSIAPKWIFTISRAEDLRIEQMKPQITPYILGGVVSAILISMVILGLMGVLWQNVTRRTKEIGLRRANGATAGNIFGQIIGEMIIVATLGIVPGVLLIAHLLALDILGFIPNNIHIAAMISAAGVLYGVVTICSIYPGCMAMKVSPAAALHYE